MVDLAARRTHQAARLRAESEILSFLAGSVLRGETTPGGPAGAGPGDLRHGVGGAAGAGRATSTRGPARAASAPAARARAPRTRTWTCRSATTWRWRSPAGCCPPRTAGCSPPSPPRPPSSWTASGCVGEAEQARQLAEGNRIRTALLAAVSHDLRTPLAGIKAAVTSLRSDDVAWSEEDEAELLAGIEDGADRLDHLVGNLLDMSRLQTGTVTPLIREIDLDEVVPMALGGVPEGSVDAGHPRDPADGRRRPRPAGARRWPTSSRTPSSTARAGEPVLVAASALGDRVEVRVVDRGPGVPDEAKDRIFEPFQRYGDAPRGAGVGLGLAVARGFAEAMGGTLDAEDTPGGGLTMVLTLRAAAGPAGPPGPTRDGVT